mgnify:CR=1 FL=1
MKKSPIPEGKWYLTSFVSAHGDQNCSMVAEHRLEEFIRQLSSPYENFETLEEFTSSAIDEGGGYEFLEGGTLDIQLFNPETDLIQ